MTKTNNSVQLIPVDEIDFVFKDRSIKSAEKEASEASKPLLDLVTSIRINGLIHPIVVKKRDNGRYEKIVGARRITAYKLLGKKEIEAFVMDSDVPDSKAYSVLLDENILREDLDLISKTESLLKLLAIYVNEKLYMTSLNIINQDDLIQKGKTFFNKAYYVYRLIKKGETYNLNGEQLKLFDVVDEYLKEKRITYSYLIKKITLLSFDSFLKNLLVSDFITVTKATKINQIFEKNKAVEKNCRLDTNEILQKLEGAIIDFNEAKKEINSLMDKIIYIDSFGSTEKYRETKKYTTVVKNFLKKMKTKELSGEQRKKINSLFEEIDKVLDLSE